MKLEPNQANAARPARLRIVCLFADFHDHAVMFLIARLFEIHDRERFSVPAFSFGPERDDETRTRIEAGVDAFDDLRRLRDKEVAALARREGIDAAAPWRIKCDASRD